MYRIVLIAATLLVSFGGASAAELVELVVESTGPLAGQADPSGPTYQRLRGYAKGELDPHSERNRVIVNLNRAPVNAKGRVEYQVDVEIHRPVDPGHRNGTLLYDVVNRGNKAVTRIALPDAGYTFVWSGWQGDLTADGERLTARLPVAVDGDEAIVGLSREEFIGSRPSGPITGRLQYPAASLDRERATLTVRQNERDPRRPLESWRYIDEREIEITRPGAPYDAGAIFEFIYPARDPIVAGIGFAAMRDVNSFLRYEDADRGGNANPLRADGASIDHAMALGVSQSGRMLRHFVHLGLNEDERGRRIFDGAMPIIPGSRKTWANTQFAQPGRWSKQHEDHLQPGDQFPFTYPVTTDPLTGRRDGIFARCRASATCPKIAHVDGEFEVWGARGSLLVTDGNPSGPSDLAMPDDVRLYMVAGTPHGGGGRAVPADDRTLFCQNILNPLGVTVVNRAILVALHEWVTAGREPPPSRYGSVSDGTLVAADPASLGFPAIPGVVYNGRFNSLRVTDYGAMPPREGAEYGILVPRVDSDGNALAGIRLPALEVPVATYTGWNLRRGGFAEGEGCSAFGSYIPLPRTAAERTKSGDPRPAIDERYGGVDYVQRVSRAAADLVADRYLLAEDADQIVEEAKRIAVDWPAELRQESQP